MRTITTDTQSRIDAQSGEEPICILKLVLGSETLWIADREATEGGILLMPLLQSVGELKTQVRVDGEDRWLGTVGVMKFTILDDDEAIRTRLESTPLQGSAAEVYFAWGGQAQSDWTLLLKGKIEMPGEWAEDDRSLSLTVETPRRYEETPFTPDADTTLDVDEQFQGQTWPMIFGDAVRDALAQQVKAAPQSRLVQDVDQDATSFVVEEADELFPQGSEITLQVGDEWMTGSFSGETFTVTARQVDREYDIAVSGNGAEITVPSGVRAVGTYIQIKDTFFAASTGRVLYTGYCYEQEGTTCRMWNGNPNFTVSATYRARVNRYPYTPSAGAQWVHKGGTTVTQIGVGATYVASEVPLSDVIRVRAWRQVTNDDTGYSRRELVTVDPALYTVTLTDAAYNGATTISFDMPLSARGAGWEDQVYVSAESSVGSNTADIIEWLIENKSSLTVDAASFATARTAVAKYPMNFARRVPSDVLNFAAEIAWQARCGITWNGSAVVLRYLSAEPSSGDIPLNDTTIAEGGITESATPVTDLTTVFVAEWRRDASDEEPRTKTYRNNVALYGRRRKVFEFWAYQKGSLVAKSASFWAARYSRSWRRMHVNLWGFEGLGIDPLDYANWEPSDFYDAVKGLVLSAWVGEDHTKLMVELPIEAGTTSESADYWQDDSGDTAPATPSIPAGQPEIETVSAEAPQAITFNDDPTNTFSVVAVENEVSLASSSEFKTVRVRIRGTTEQEIASQIAVNTARIAEIDVLDPAAINGTLQAEKASLESDNASLTIDLGSAQDDGEEVTAINGEVSFMLIGDTGIMVKVPGGSYYVTPDNATGPFVAEVTKRPASPAEGTLHADIGLTTSPLGSEVREIEILGDGSSIEVGDKLLVFRDAKGSYYTSAPGGGGGGLFGIIGSHVSTLGTKQTYNATLSNGDAITVVQQYIDPVARIPSGTPTVIVLTAAGTYVCQVPVWLETT